MKTFNDLVFNQHPIKDGEQARLDFENGYGVSVLKGSAFYTSDEKPFEVAVFKYGDICYDTNITTDVVGYLDEDAVTKIMAEVQKLDSNSAEAHPGWLHVCYSLRQGACDGDVWDWHYSKRRHKEAPVWEAESLLVGLDKGGMPTSGLLQERRKSSRRDQAKTGVD